MNKIVLMFMFSGSLAYAADPKLSMKKMRTLDELCHCGCLRKVIAFTTTLDCLKKEAFTLGQNDKISYGIITYQKQKDLRSFPYYQIIIRIFKKMEADGFECSLGHVRGASQGKCDSDRRSLLWDKEFEELFKKSNLAIRFATDAEKEQLKNAMNARQAKLAFDCPSYRQLATQCFSKGIS